MNEQARHRVETVKEWIVFIEDEYNERPIVAFGPYTLIEAMRIRDSDEIVLDQPQYVLRMTRLRSIGN